MNPREKIVEQFNSLSPEFQCVAKFILQHANRLVVQSIRAFGAEGDLKHATRLRLAQRLGYHGWGELKSAMINDMGCIMILTLPKRKNSSPKARNLNDTTRFFTHIRPA